MRNQRRKTYVSAALALLLLLVTAGSASAIVYELTAEETDIVMPDGISVPAWGYRLSASPDPATVPGPVLTVPPGDNRLVIDLTNNLPEATSLHILGQTLSYRGSPVDQDGRVLSMNKHVQPGNTMRYQFTGFRPGTYMLQSATNPAKQVQMGLFTAVTKNAAPGEAYPGVPYDDERILVFHEVDPAIQNAIAIGDYGTPASAVPSSVYRRPTYFLINGHAYPETGLADVATGQTVLLRFINAGLETHVPQILGKYVTLVAQDGNRRSFDQEAYGFELNSAATMDALLQLGAADEGARIAIYDARTKHLSNTGAVENSYGVGGMLVHLNVGAAAAATDTLTILRTRYLNSANTPTELRVWATSDDPAAVISVDGYPATDMTVRTFSDPNVLNGGFTRVFVANVSANPGSATAVSSAGGSATSGVPFTVPPEAANDAYPTDADTPLAVAADGVLANDLKGGWVNGYERMDAISVSATANGVLNLAPDGSFTYTPNAGFTGQDTFSYQVRMVNANNGNTLATSAPATVTIFVNPAVP